MASKNLLRDKIISEKVVELRTNKGWSQKEFGLKLTELSPKKNVVSQTSISMWENRERPIPMVYLTPLSQLFGVTEDYLLGLTDDPQGDREDKTAEFYSKYEVHYWELYAYDKQPIYLDFGETMKHENGWAIYNRAKGWFVFPDDVVQAKALEGLGVKYFSIDVSRLSDSLTQRKTLGLDEVMKRDTVYIQMLSTDRYVRGLYDGWYRHNETRTALINSEGNVLPYNGLKKVYYAYSLRSQKS